MFVFDVGVFVAVVFVIVAVVVRVAVEVRGICWGFVHDLQLVPAPAYCVLVLWG